MAQTRQKSCADISRRNFHFDVDDWVYSIIAPTKDVMILMKKRKLGPCYGGLYRF